MSEFGGISSYFCLLFSSIFATVFSKIRVTTCHHLPLVSFSYVPQLVYFRGVPLQLLAPLCVHVVICLFASYHDNITKKEHLKEILIECNEKDNNL